MGEKSIFLKSFFAGLGFWVFYQQKLGTYIKCCLEKYFFYILLKFQSAIGIPYNFMAILSKEVPFFKFLFSGIEILGILLSKNEGLFKLFFRIILFLYYTRISEIYLNSLKFCDHFTEQSQFLKSFFPGL